MVHIVHLSDFHFYNHSNWDNMKRCLLRVLKEKAELSPENETLLVITGDFHNFGKDYDEAKKFLDQLVKAMNLDITQDVFVVPGNHDKVYSDDEKIKASQTLAIKAVQSDFGELENKHTIEFLLDPFSSYDAFCKELKIYDENSAPSAVHIRTWNNKLNIIHLNTALVADGKIKENQLFDIKTLTSDEFVNSIPDEYPAIAIGHNDFYDLHDRIMVEATPVFKDKAVCAYLCGDKHRFLDQRIKKHISLGSRYGDKRIPNIVCGKCTTDEQDTYSDFGFYIHCWDENTGWVDLEKYIWDDAIEQNDFTVKTDRKAYKLISSKNDIDPTDLYRLDIIRKFTQLLKDLGDEDGMMKCLYSLFQKQITDNKLSIAELKILSIVLEEYNNMYNKYYIEKGVAETEGLDRILSDKNVIKMEKNTRTNPLIITYLQFIRADRKYFTNDLDGAIKDYQEAYNIIHAQYKNGKMKKIDKERCAYLLNSIAWTYKRKGDNKSALEWYGKLFDEFTDIDTYAFAWRYRRNYGVCLENKKEFVEAINQYEIVIKSIPNSNIHEYKIYLTYCSAMMKYWDSKTEKTSGQWIEKVRELYIHNDDYINDDRIIDICANLRLADDKHRVIDSTNLLPDYYNQLSKVLTYKMIIASDDSVINKLKEEVEKNLKILNKVNSSAIGQHFIKRDFYYALYEITQDTNKKEKYYQIAWNENEQLNGKGDAVEFQGMLERKKDC